MTHFRSSLDVSKCERKMQQPCNGLTADKTGCDGFKTKTDNQKFQKFVNLIVVQSFVTVTIFFKYQK